MTKDEIVSKLLIYRPQMRYVNGGSNEPSYSTIKSYDDRFLIFDLNFNLVGKMLGFKRKVYYNIGFSDLESIGEFKDKIINLKSELKPDYVCSKIGNILKTCTFN